MTIFIDPASYFNEVCETIRVFDAAISLTQTDQPQLADLLVWHQPREDRSVFFALLQNPGELPGPEQDSEALTGPVQDSEVLAGPTQGPEALARPAQGSEALSRCNTPLNMKMPALEGHAELELCLPTEPLLRRRMEKHGLKLVVYQLMKKQTGIHPPWGSLTGIRPTKLAVMLADQGQSYDAVRNRLIDFYDLTLEKTDLLFKVLDAQQGVRSPAHNAKNEIDLYVGIPFCPTRCSYCSFPAYALDKKTRPMVDGYLEALIREIQGCIPLLQGRTVRAVYVGGGTPTSISPAQMDKLLAVMRQAWGSGGEWTVEAGRPDTINSEMVRVLRGHGVSRISVNPQTMNAATLARIGRSHTVEAIAEAMALVSDFPVVNMDVIAGLPGEVESDFAHTLQQILALSPQNITVHSLAAKRASQIWLDGGVRLLPDQAVVTRMVEHAQETLMSRGLLPYYLYRQKYMAGNLENIGYALPGTACLYNVDIMEETHSVLAFGVGAISKWVSDGQDRLERACNMRSLEEYIGRNDEMIERKRKLMAGEAQAPSQDEASALLKGTARTVPPQDAPRSEAPAPPESEASTALRGKASTLPKGVPPD